MKMSNLFSTTLRDAPAETEIAGHRLLLRAGYVRQLAAGVFSYLPLANRALTKIERILRQEIERIGGQEVSMPIVQPAELWQESGRWYKIDAELSRFIDRTGRNMVLAMTHEEVVGDLTRREIRSYRQLPKLLYQIQSKWRDDPRPRAGLIRGREFLMKDSYSLDLDETGLEAQYQAHYRAYFRIFARCGLEVIAVQADTGMMGGHLAHEYMYLTPIGEDTLLICDSCGSAANRQVATFRKPVPPAEAHLPAELVATPGAKSIAELAAFLEISESRTAKAVFMLATTVPEHESQEVFVFAVVRGDMEVNETKLANLIQARSMRPATEEEIRSVGAVPGYASPVGIRRDGKLRVIVVVDDLVAASANLVAGANQPGYHLRNTCYGRDFSADITADITAAQDGDACQNCGAPLHSVRGVEVGNIFKLGTFYSQSLGVTYLDSDGKEKPVVMGSYGIGVTRLLACIAEAHHDEFGLAWPVSVAPYQVHLVILPGKGQEVETQAVANQLYQDLWAAGVEVLMDDRNESPGVKFNDADLIGLPLRLTVSGRGLATGSVELKLRGASEKIIIPRAEAVQRVQAEILALQSALDVRGNFA